MASQYSLSLSLGGPPQRLGCPTGDVYSAAGGLVTILAGPGPGGVAALGKAKIDASAMMLATAAGKRSLLVCTDLILTHVFYSMAEL
ncbi:MAG: hypothetical protein HYY30_04385 [Chloroflexi bacterium]|nr:hypothetical protein [Chloroflexota bacterium]